MFVAATADRPAILGDNEAITPDGRDANRWPIITDEDVTTVTDVLRSGELSLHKIAQELEKDCQSWLGVRHVLACCNGTSAIFAATPRRY